MTVQTLKMDLFLRYLFNEEPRPDDWQDIYSAYIGLRENKSTSFILNLQKQIFVIRSKQQITDSLCKVMLICFDHTLRLERKEVKEQLRLQGYSYPFDFDSPKEFAANIRAVYSRNKKGNLDAIRMEKELAEYEKRYAGKELSWKDFYIWAVTLSQHFGYRVGLETVTVTEWCTMQNQYEQYCEVQNAQTNNKLKKGK
jgi:hypothetical protein